MSRKKRKAKTKENQPKEDNLDGWDAKSASGVLKGTKFATPPCPEDSKGFHQYVQGEGTRRCRIWRCRCCGRTLGINRRTGNVRERRA